MKREALSHPVAILGVLITTASAVLFVSLIIAILAGLLRNPYVGLVVFVAIQVSVTGLYRPPVTSPSELSVPPQTIISLPVQTAV